MNYPSEYQPTLKDPEPYYGYENNDIVAYYGVCLGVSYIGPWFSLPSPFRNGSDIFVWGLTASKSIQDTSDLLKKLPTGVRGGRGSFIELYDVNYFNNDKIVDSSSGTLSFRGLTTVNKNFQNRVNLEYINSSGFNGTPWPIEGVSAMNAIFKSYCQELQKAGATIDMIMNDTESIQFALPNSSLLSSFLGNSAYYERYGGLSSWKDWMDFYGATATDLITSGGFQWYLGNQANWAWAKVAQKYWGESVRLGYFNGAQEVFPNIVTSNYEHYEGENKREDEALEANGLLWPQGGRQGNAGSPVLYGRLRHISSESSTGNSVRLDNPTYLWSSSVERTTYFRNGPRLTLSVMTSFLQAMMEMRTAARNSTGKCIAPWINSIFTQGYSSEGHFQNFVFDIGYGQSPAEVLSDHWYPINIVGRILDCGGITSYDGSTTACLIKTSIPMVSETWYKQNIDSITFDGATTAYQIKTSGICGTTSALAYYLNRGLTSGNTYVFSYFIDVTRGFSGFNARFINWSTSDSIGSAPSLTTTSGITFRQILPVTGPVSYLQTPIQYNVGDSGWIKVAFEFTAPSSNPLLGLHVYHGTNTSEGYTAYIKDVFLNHQANGTTASLSFIGNKNKNFSLEYYYNGLTTGITYIFSYYLDVSKSYTGSDALQTLNHFQIPTYGFPLGITYNQILPSVRNSIFHTAGMCYGSGITWTKISYEFSIPVGNTYDPINRKTLAASVFKTNVSVLDKNDVLLGACLYIASPSLEIKGTTQNTIIPVSNIDAEVVQRWQYGPPIGWLDAKKGLNQRYNVYFLNRGGNSAYFGELIRHCCLCRSAKFGFFNASDYVDFSVPGSIRIVDPGFIGFDLGAGKTKLYTQSGRTAHQFSFIYTNSILKEVNERLGGFTSSSADLSRVNWMAPYIASGAPGLNGITWWWRITALEGYTTYCNGITLSSRGTVGTWVETSGPTLAGVNITSTKWTKADALPEPTISTPTKKVDFDLMSSLTDLTNAGFTFSRGSTASYVNSNGLIAYAGPNQPRFHHDENTLAPMGLLLEGGNTNLLNWSESFAISGGANNNWTDFKLNRTTGNTSPSGDLSAIRFTATGANATILSTTTIGSTAFRNFNIFIRGITGNESVFYTTDGGNTWTPIQGSTSYYNASSVTYTLQPQNKKLTTSWTRYTFPSTTENHRVGIKLGNTLDSIELWGAQLEPRNSSLSELRKFYSSYVPTTSTSVTTSKDICSISGTSFSSWCGITYGSFVFENICDIENQNVMFELKKDNSNYIRMNQYFYSMRISGAVRGQPFDPYPTINLLTGTPCRGVEYKYILTYGPHGFKYSGYKSDGYLIPYESAFNWPGNTIGAPEFTQLSFDIEDTMIIRNIRYWPFVFDQETMKGMAQGNVDPSFGWIGAWDGPPIL